MPSAKEWQLQRVVQCAKCPWRKDVDPREISDGYSVEKHRTLASTIAHPGDVTAIFSPGLHVMACHETGDTHCVGWLRHQVGPGNNIALRLHLRQCTNAHQLRVIGPQHARFVDTLPE